MNKIDLELGDLLVAPPTMQDPRFKKSVVILLHHDDDGSLGLCMNKPTSYCLDKISEQLGIFPQIQFPLFWGGPVSPGTIWMLHSAEWSSKRTLSISAQWSMTSNEDMFHKVAEGDLPKYFRFFHGFCSWQSSQLEKEILGDEPWHPKSSWLIVNQPCAIELLESDLDSTWEEYISKSSQQAVDTWF